jgi:4-phytase/acid phosphatase
VSVTKSAILIAICATAAIAQQSIPGEELRFAVVVSRHGVRSPTWTPERLNQYSAAPWPDWGVAPGILTPHGRELMKIMGEFYREYFRNLPGGLDCAKVAFKADSAQRTRVTAEALAEGIVPGCTVDVHALSEGEHDSLFAAEARDAKLLNAAVAGRLGPQLSSLVAAHQPALDLLARTLNGGGKTKRSIFDEPLALTQGDEGVSLSGPINLASTLSEDFLLEYTNGMSGDKFAWGRLTPAKLLDLMSLHAVYADLMRRTPTVAQSRGRNLLNAVSHSLEQRWR